MLVCGCSPEPEPDVVHSIAAHLAPGCTENAESLVVQLNALGDFDASPRTSEALPGDSRDVEIGFPASTRAIEAIADGSRGRFLGIANVDAAGAFDVLLWNSKSACQLWDPNAASGDPYPGATGGEAFGVSEDGRYALLAGGLTNTENAVRALHFRLDTGQISEVPDNMLPGRAFATVTQFGQDAMLVAGGSDPLNAADLALAPPVGTAIVFSHEKQRFDRNTLINLSAPRTKHGAAVLLSGETVLVGGLGSTGVALSTLEVVSPVDRAARIVGTLKRSRRSPFVTRLSDGRVFVAGGLSDAFSPVESCEWHSADAEDFVQERAGLVFAPRQAFVALPGASVLAVGVCDPNRADCSEPQRSVSFIRANGGVDPLPDLPGDAADPVLLSAADGAPWLAIGSAAGRVMRRYDPWLGMFVQPSARPSRAPEVDLPALAFDGGSFGFLSRSGSSAEVFGFRHGTRGRYARAAGPLLLGSAENLVPDRAPGKEIYFDAAGLHLEGSSATAHLADADFADVHVAMDLTSGPPPIVHLGDTLVGVPNCPWPEQDIAIQLSVTRTGKSLKVQRGSAQTTCDGPTGRATLALSAAGTSSVIRSLEIRRSVP